MGRHGKPVRAIFGILCLLLCGGLSLLVATPLIAGELSHRATLDGLDCSVVAQTKTRAIPHEGARWWGTMNEGPHKTTPQSFLEKLEVRLGKIRVEVPLSAFADLANVRKITLRGESWVECHEGEGGPAPLRKAQTGRSLVKATVLRIEGGDAAASYIADIQIQSNRVVMRTVAQAEFPDIVLEKTFYYINDSNR